MDTDFHANIIDFESVFRMLNDELTILQESLAIICAGGYVLQLNGYRGTADVDAFFNNSATIENIIRKVGDAFGINKPDELWLNNSISNMCPQPPKKFCKLVHQFSNLTVMAVDIIYLAGMKLTSARGQDLKDVAEIIKITKELDPFDFYRRLEEMNFLIDVSILFDVFGDAFGMDWLEKFYKAHEKELRELF